MTLLLSFMAFGGIALLAAISPGPDFLVVSKNSIRYSRRAGMMTAVGVGSAILIHVAYTIVGVGLIIAQSILLFSAIKFLGAIYLFYLGIQLLRARGETQVPEHSGAIVGTKTDWQAFREGFLTNVLNPKATIFFVSIFTQVVSPKLPALIQGLYGVEAALIVGVWFVGLTFMLTHSAIRPHISHMQTAVLKVMGAALILLGVRLAFEHR